MQMKRHLVVILWPRLTDLRPLRKKVRLPPVLERQSSKHSTTLDLVRDSQGRRHRHHATPRCQLLRVYSLLLLYFATASFSLLFVGFHTPALATATATTATDAIAATVTTVLHTGLFPLRLVALLAIAVVFPSLVFVGLAAVVYRHVAVYCHRGRLLSPLLGWMLFPLLSVAVTRSSFLATVTTVQVSPEAIEHVSLVLVGLELGRVEADGVLRAACFLHRRLRM